MLSFNHHWVLLFLAGDVLVKLTRVDTLSGEMIDWDHVVAGKGCQ